MGARNILSQVVVLALILVLAAYRITSPSATEEVNESLKSNISFAGDWIKGLPLIGPLIEKTHITDQVWCAYANPHLSKFFSAGGTMELAVGDPLFELIADVVCSPGAEFDSVESIKLETNEDGDISYLVQFQVLETKTGTITGGEDFDDGIDRLSSLLNLASAQEDTPFLQFTNKIPIWVCFITFGLLPFLVLYFFLRDILTLTLLSKTTTQLISIFSSLVAIQTGMFSGFVWQIAKIANMSVAGTFLTVIIFMSVISMLLSWLGIGMSAATRAKEEAQQVAEGVIQRQTAKAFFNVFRKDDKSQ